MSPVQIDTSAIAPTGSTTPRDRQSLAPSPPRRQPQQIPAPPLNSVMPAGVVHGAFAFGRGAAFFLCVFAADLAPAVFARARAALLAAARLSGDHGVY